MTAKLTVEDIIALRWELDRYYRVWHDQQREDESYYNAGSGTGDAGGMKVLISSMPDQFRQIRLPTAKTIIDTSAQHASGNFPRLHIPRRKETEKAQENTTLLERAGQGFWYRSIAEAALNPLRAWAQLGALRGAVCASLFYNDDKWPDLPPTPGPGASEADVEAYEDVVAKRKSSWPFELDYVDPMFVFPDPATEGKTYIIIAFSRMVHEVVRRWPTWDRKIPGRDKPLKMTDYVDFIAYWDDKYHSYIVGSNFTDDPKSAQGKALIKAYGGVAPHGYGFLPYFFASAGYGMPTGLPEYRYQGLLTPIRDLLSAEMENTTHIHAVVSQQSFPWLVAQRGVELNMELGGVTWAPAGVNPKDALIEMRPVVPISELMTFNESIGERIQGATIPNSLRGQRAKGVYSGYQESIEVGTGRSALRPLSDALEHTVEWATSGFFKLVENKVKGPVATWGKGMDASEFITIKPKDINGNYEVYATLTPDLPQDVSVNIANGQKLYQEGVIPARDFLETYAGRENAEDLLRERFAEDVVKSPQAQQQMVSDTLSGFGLPNYTGGPVAVPGVRATGEVGIAGGPEVGQSAATPVAPEANPQSNAGRGIPTPPAAPGSLASVNNAIAGPNLGVSTGVPGVQSGAGHR